MRSLPTLGALVAGAALWPGQSQAAPVYSLNSDIDGAQADAGAGTGSPGSGYARVGYDSVTRELRWEIVFGGLEGAVTAMHFHGPAAPGANAGVAVPIADTVSPSVGSAILSESQAADLLAGLYYINIHTSTEGGGEVRGQVLVPETLVDLDASGLPAGPLDTWANGGTTPGDFVAEVDPGQVTDVAGARAVLMNGMSQWYVGPAAPDSVTGQSSRAITAWVFNEIADDEETIFAWSRRGGPAGTNMSFNHGLHGSFGAVGHWQPEGDLGWSGHLVQGAWTFVAYVHDTRLNRTSVYTDGFLSAVKDHTISINTHTEAAGSPLPFVLGNQNEQGNTRTGALSGSMAVAQLQVHSDVISADEILDRFAEDAPVFGIALPVIAGFTATVDDAATTTLAWRVAGADAIAIDHGVGDVTGQARVQVPTPVTPTTYTLSATTGENTTTAEVVVAGYDGATLVHQWTFNSESGGDGTVLVDAVGGANGTIVDGGTREGTVGDGQVTLSGGSRATADYVQFPPGLLDGLESVTVETWATLHNSQPWGRVMSFGSGNGSANAFFLSWAVGTNRNQQRIQKQSLAQADSSLVTEYDREYHIVVVWDAEGGPAGDGEIRWYRDGQIAASIPTGGAGLDTVDDRVFWIGRSQWANDAVAEASWNEVNIYDEVLTDAQIAAHREAGSTPVPPPPRPGFRVTSIEVGENVTLTWDSLPGAAYDIEKSGDLTAPGWEPVADDVPGTGDSTSYTDTAAPAGSPVRYYRVFEKVDG